MPLVPLTSYAPEQKTINEEALLSLCVCRKSNYLNIYKALSSVHVQPSLLLYKTFDHDSELHLEFLPLLSHILANRPDLVGTVPIWRPKPDVPPDDPKKKPIRPDLSRSMPKNTILNLPLPVLFVLQLEFKFLLCL